jgi:hypothetical protein
LFSLCFCSAAGAGDIPGGAGSGQDSRSEGQDQGQEEGKARQLTHNPDSEDEGQDKKIGGKVPKKVGQVEKVLEK